jgi:hypothetical protein
MSHVLGGVNMTFRVWIRERVRIGVRVRVRFRLGLSVKYKRIQNYKSLKIVTPPKT